MMLFALLLFAGACSDDPQEDPGGKPDVSSGKTQAGGDPKPPPTTGPETTGDTSPPEVTLGQDPGERPEVVIRLEGDPKTTFTGLCSVGQEQNVLSGRVPERFTFNLAGKRLECRIQKHDQADGDLKVVLVAGDATRSVQQTNAPGGTINLLYESE